MPFMYSFQPGPSRFVLLRAFGDVSLVMWSDAMRHVIADRAFRGSMPILLDVTEATGAGPQPDEIVTIARVWRLLTPRSRGGIIASEGQNLRLAQSIERLSGEHLRAFADFPSAVQWVHNSAANPVPHLGPLRPSDTGRARRPPGYIA